MNALRVFEEYCERVHRIGEGYVCAMKEEHVIPLIQLVKHQYVVESMDRVEIIDKHDPEIENLNDVECLVLFVPAVPDEDTDNLEKDPSDWWKEDLLEF
tara:strand:+ start:383 stop:679 length:297 start_codon:yes stop_codon:yes gene_type:complete